MQVHPAIKSISVESLRPLKAVGIRDDDWYVYNDATKVVAAIASGKGPRPQCAPGQYAVSGLTVKLSGLQLFQAVVAQAYTRGAA